MSDVKIFTDLVVWQEGHRLVIDLYKVTSKFPKEEVYGLVSQMRRCGVSITSNVAEGFGRQHSREKLQFYFHANGSIVELMNQLLIARDVGLLAEVDFDRLYSQSKQTQRVLQGLIRSTRK